MSDTPRMDAVQWLAEDGAGGTHSVVSLADARKLELELNAANDRIKRLEELAEELVEESDIYNRRGIWQKAKEAKP